MVYVALTLNLYSCPFAQKDNVLIKQKLQLTAIAVFEQISIP